MKKYLAMILTLCVLAAFAGCASSKTETIPETTEAVTAVIVTQPETTEETAPDPVNKLDPAAIIGVYADAASQRATMEVTFDEASETYRIVVTWGNGVDETAFWNMTCKENENMQLVYTDCEHVINAYPKNGESTTTVLYQNGAGYFTFDPETGKLLWDGAADESCKGCAFELLPPYYIDDIPEKGDPTAVIGDYMDLTSQRARMTLDYDFEKDIYICEVTWANSAMEQEVWKMHWTDIGNGKYVYDDGEHLKVTYAENGEAATTVLAQNQSGFFTYDNADDLRVTETAILDRFFWDGAADENCRTCHFEQME